MMYNHTIGLPRGDTVLVYTTGHRMDVTRDPKAAGGLVFTVFCTREDNDEEIPWNLAERHEGLMTSAVHAMNANQNADFGLFLYILFRQGLVAAAEILAEHSFRVVPKDGQESTAMWAVQMALGEPYSRISFSFQLPAE